MSKTKPKSAQTNISPPVYPPNHAQIVREGGKYRPSNALEYTHMAIVNLEKIQPKDLEWDMALEQLAAWIATKRYKKNNIPDPVKRRYQLILDTVCGWKTKKWRPE